MHRFANPARFLKIARPLTLWLFWPGLMLILIGAVCGLLVTPADYLQGQTVRILYIHVPAAWLGMGGWAGIAVAANGDIFVADGHPANGNNRIVKFSSAGRYLMEWGETGAEQGQFRTPHGLAMDSGGLLYVGDRSNRRVQVFTQEGEFVRDYYNVGRTSGIFIDNNDWMYIADSESQMSSNPGFSRGIRVIDLETATILFFIPDPEASPGGTSAAEGVAVDNDGNVYGAEVGPRALRKHVAPPSFGRMD